MNPAELFRHDRPRVLGRSLIRNLAVPGFSVAGIPGDLFSDFRGLRPSAEKIERFVANGRADIGVNLCVAAAANPIASNDVEELVEGRGDDVLAIGLTQVPDSPEDGRRSDPYPSGKQLPGKGLLRPTAFEQATQFSRYHRARSKHVPPPIKTLGGTIPSRTAADGLIANAAAVGAIWCACRLAATWVQQRLQDPAAAAPAAGVVGQRMECSRYQRL